MKVHTAVTKWILLCLIANPSFAKDNETRIKSGHNLLKDDARAALEPGMALGPLAFKTVGGQSIYLADTLKQGPAVFVFLSTQCPLAKRYTGRLNRLHDSYANRGVKLFAIFPNSDETEHGIQDYLKSVKFKFAAVRDVGGYLTKRLDGTMTPQVFLVDRRGVLRYRGAFDDNRYEDRVSVSHLAAALDAVLSGKPVESDSVNAVGCTIHRDVELGKGETTYTGHVARILQDNCQSCHRPKQVAPFPLTNYTEAKRWKTEIKEYTEARVMPPWKATRGVAHYKNDISLTDEEIDLIADWADHGAPEGDPALTPPAPRYHDGWAYGQPDLIIEMPEEYLVAAEGEDDYRHFVVPHEDTDGKHRFVEALDVRPGNRNVVHHVIAYVDTSGKARELDAADPGPGYTKFGGTGFDATSVLGGWAPGNSPVKTPSGTGNWLPPKCDVVLQVHYYRSGVEERDKTMIGIYFSKDADPVPVRGSLAINHDFTIPPKAKRYEVRAERTIKQNSYLFSVTPHMHLIGETMEVNAHLPNGEVLPMVKIDDWDFNWQTTYHFQELRLLPKGTKVKLVATFDNSAENPNNPNREPKPISWGEKTTDEMCIAFFGLLRESEYDPQTKRRRAKLAAGQDGQDSPPTNRPVSNGR